MPEVRQMSKYTDNKSDMNISIGRNLKHKKPCFHHKNITVREFHSEVF